LLQCCETKYHYLTTLLQVLGIGAIALDALVNGWLHLLRRRLAGHRRLLRTFQGVLISDVFKDQPADKAGIKRGDVILSIDGKKVTSSNELRNTVANISPGAKTPLALFRAGKELSLTVKLTERNEGAIDKIEGDSGNDGENPSEALKQLGLQTSNLTEALRKQYSIDKDVSGVVVIEVDQVSQAASEGIQEGDVIQEVNREAVTSVKEFAKAVKSIKIGDNVMLLVKRGQSTLYIAFTMKK